VTTNNIKVGNIILIVKGETRKVGMTSKMGFGIGVTHFEDFEDTSLNGIPLEVLAVNEPLINVQRFQDNTESIILDLRKIKVQILDGDFIKSIQFGKGKSDEKK